MPSLPFPTSSATSSPSKSTLSNPLIIALTNPTLGNGIIIIIIIIIIFFFFFFFFFFFLLLVFVRLCIGGNQLLKLPKAIGNLAALEHLDMKSNQINALPPDMGQLKACTKMDMSHNMLSELPWEMGQLDALAQLNVDHNPILLPPKIVITQGTRAIVDWLQKNEKSVRLVPFSFVTVPVAYCLVVGRVGRRS